MLANKYFAVYTIEMDKMMGENSKISFDNKVDVNIKVYPIRKRTFSAEEDNSSTQVIFYLLFLLD